MSNRKRGKKKTPKRVLGLPDLEHAKTAVLNSLTSASGQRTYEHAIRNSSPGTARSPGWPSIGRLFCDTASTSNSATTRQRPSICDSRGFDASRMKPQMPGSSARNWRRAHKWSVCPSPLCRHPSFQRSASNLCSGGCRQQTTKMATSW